jgi:hypothetical protein
MVISFPEEKTQKPDGASARGLMARLGPAAANGKSTAVAAVEERLEDERGFLELQACIPHLAESKTASRLDILLEAINYIDILHTTLIHKIHRGDQLLLSGEERRRVLAQYLANMVKESNKEN